METQLKALGQWEVVDGTTVQPNVVDPANPTPDETRQLTAWKLRAARAYAEIALRVEDEYGETIATTDDPHGAWVLLESSYGSRQSGPHEGVTQPTVRCRTHHDRYAVLPLLRQLASC